MLPNWSYFIIASLILTGGCLTRKYPVFESQLEVEKHKIPLKEYLFEFAYPAKYNDEIFVVARKKETDSLFFYKVQGEGLELVYFRKLQDSTLMKPMYDNFKDELHVERIFIVHPDTLLFYSRGTIHGDFSSWKI